eukprot:15366473-Ditylum_brightwellii.AAC.1
MYALKDQNIAPTTNTDNLIKCTIAVEIKKILPGIISSTVCEISQTGLANKTTTTSKDNTGITITGEKSTASGKNNTNKFKKPNDKETTATATLTQGSLLDTPPLEKLSSKDSSSDSESDKNNTIKDKDAKPMKDKLIQHCNSTYMQEKQKKSVAFDGVPDNPGSNACQE